MNEAERKIMKLVDDEVDRRVAALRVRVRELTDQVERQARTIDRQSNHIKHGKEARSRLIAERKDLRRALMDFQAKYAAAKHAALPEYIEFEALFKHGYRELVCKAMNDIERIETVTYGRSSRLRCIGTVHRDKFEGLKIYATHWRSNNA